MVAITSLISFSVRTVTKGMFECLNLRGRHE